LTTIRNKSSISSNGINTIDINDRAAKILKKHRNLVDNLNVSTTAIVAAQKNKGITITAIVFSSLEKAKEIKSKIKDQKSLLY
jgi:hypothetical protein